ncbi:SNF2 family N-terminal domain-containing protein [Zopfochytrium polystomum]|nr:SNF2 family N-terminal domain-containing protein [Zopfochytrium polystomum]
MPDKTNIDKFLSWRISESGKEELLVKYKNMSYYHAEWVPRESVETGRMGKMRVQRFMSKPTWDAQWTEEEPFNPSFKKIDRIIDDGDANGEVFYLVKWCAQTYDLCTWEPAYVCEELDSTKVEEFHSRKLINSSKFANYASGTRRPPPSEWSKMEESPVYKNSMCLRPYQLEGLNWLLFCWYHRQNSILADEMGLGKTVQSTVFMNYLYQRCNVKGPFLVVTPLSTIGNWEREIQTWTDLNVVVYHGKDMARNLIVETEYYYRDANGEVIPQVYKFDVILTTYEMTINGASQLRPVPWRCVILDEAQRLKNKASKVSEALKTYKMEHKVLLTGTPLQNSLEELWSLLNFIEPEKFSSEKAFQAEYGTLNGANDVKKIQAILKPLMLRRLKEDVEKSIPMKEETIVEVELTTMQKKWYRSILERNFTWLKQGLNKKSNMPNLINTMLELRKCCIHPFLLRGAEETIYSDFDADTPEKQYSALVQASGKMVLIDKLLRKLKAGGHKVLIFSQMTKCLDLIQDYLRGQKWGFERIDGSVRGDVRQASIDRFSSPESESFVFLLCTKAGGVGINLTVADTVIIFDSDWNPQNDLQAQSRVHRIGQTKPVQIYRLITRNTYEREMFDRASLKLGLDRAILQRMDANSAYGGAEEMDSKAPQLSKAEIEALLKKGAYGAFLDDEASQTFCEEDIDQILQRRTQVIKQDSNAKSEQGSIFSKATFSHGGATSPVQLDINDPDFWDKVAQKAELTVTEQAPVNDLIMTEPRARKQGMCWYTVFCFSLTVSKEETPAPKRKEAPRMWPLAERGRLEKGIMTYGYAGWDKIKELCRHRSVDDLKARKQACARTLIRNAIRADAVEPEIVQDVIADLVADGVPDIMNEQEDIPYPGATKKQIAEFRSFFMDAGKEFQENMTRKAKTLLIRLQMIHIIREKINPGPTTKMPHVIGAPPRPWWGEAEDRDLLIGTVRHGYGQYSLIFSDPTLCFAQRAAQSGNPSSLDDPTATVVSAASSTVDRAGGQNASAPSNGTSEAVDSKIDKMDTDESTDDRTLDDVKDDGIKDDEDDDMKNEDAVGADGDGKALDLAFPSPSELGVRVRKILNAYGRYQAMVAREEQKKLQIEEKMRAKQEREEEKVKAKERELNKKDRLEFYRAIVSYGVDNVPGSADERDWTRFKEISGLRKSDEILETYYQRLVGICHDMLYPNPGSAPLPDRDLDGMTPEKAKKLLKRVEAMRNLREKVINHPYLDQSIQILRQYSRLGLPDWWTSEHDKAYLQIAAKWGLHRPDLYVEDDSFPFKAAYQEYLIDRKDGPGEPGKFDERFWMKEGVATKRFTSLCECVLNPISRRGALSIGTPPATGSSSKSAEALSPGSGKGSSRKRKSAIESAEAPSSRSKSSKLKRPAAEELEMDVPIKKRKKSSEAPDKALKRRKHENDSSSSGADTDRILGHEGMR